jgi:hypothetical protein
VAMWEQQKTCRAFCNMRDGVIRMIDHADFSVVVKNRAPPPKSWRWEIYRTGRNSAVERSKSFFATATEANRAGKLALRLLLSEYPEQGNAG